MDSQTTIIDDESIIVMNARAISMTTSYSPLERQLAREVVRLSECAQIYGWISVEERYPDHLTMVLLVHKGSVFRGCFSNFSKQWLLDEDVKIKDGKVTHWMPLPEPPLPPAPSAAREGEG